MNRLSVIVLFTVAAFAVPASAAGQDAAAVPRVATYVSCWHGRVITVHVQIPSGRYSIEPPSSATCVGGN